MRKVFPILLFLILTLVLFYKVFLGFYPYAGNLLVSFFFPWSGGGFEGYDSWTTHKEFIGSDSIRMQLPWKVLAFDLIKKGQRPFWNPYNFSGNPLLANYQSGIFYPLNIFYFIFHPLTAWTILTILEVFLAMLFMFLLLRKLKISQTASIFGALAFISSSFFISWLEIDIIGHTYLWLPLIIYLIEVILVDKKRSFYPLISLAMAFSIFAGYPQTAILMIFYSILYFLFRLKSLINKKKELAYFFLFLGFGLGLAGIQLLPTLELYYQSPLAQPFAGWTFEHFLIPFNQLVTFFAPDFFGNPATNNFWGRDYGDLTPSIGVIPLFFALLAIFRKKKKDQLINFLFLTSIIFLFLAIKSPLSWLVEIINLPILSSGTPARILCLLFFNLAILSGFGFDYFLTSLQEKSAKEKIKFLISVFLFVYFCFWIFAFFGSRIIPGGQSLVDKLSVTRRNLILPTVSFSALVIVFIYFYYFRHFFNKKVNKCLLSLSSLGIICLVFLNLFYSLQKYNPFSPQKFFFPDHPVLNFLKSKSETPDRFYGVETAHFGDNFASYYQLYAAEGYDALRISRYAELIAAVQTGQVPKEYLRSDALFPKEDSENRRKIFNLLGIKYLLDKDDAATKNWEPQPWKFPEDRYQLIWQKGKWKVYENLEALPRSFLVNNYLVLKNDEEIIKKIFSPDFNPKETVILEEEIVDQIKLTNKSSGKVQFVNYSPNKVVLKVETEGDSLLFFSDSFYPGWKAFVDNEETKIYCANYAFRAITVPIGNHTVIFSYQPISFKIGSLISLLSFLGCLHGLIKKEFCFKSEKS